MRNAIAMGLAWCLLSGCASLRPVVVHDPVEVTRYVYVPVAKGLTAPCPIAMPRDDSGSELLRVARERRRSLEGCNADKRAIGRIQGTPSPSGVKP